MKLLFSRQGLTVVPHSKALAPVVSGTSMFGAAQCAVTGLSVPSGISFIQPDQGLGSRQIGLSPRDFQCFILQPVRARPDYIIAHALIRYCPSLRVFEGTRSSKLELGTWRGSRGGFTNSIQATLPYLRTSVHDRAHGEQCSRFRNRTIKSCLQADPRVQNHKAMYTVLYKQST